MKFNFKLIFIHLSIPLFLVKVDALRCELVDPLCKACSEIAFVCGHSPTSGSSFLGQLFLQFMRLDGPLADHEVVKKIFRTLRYNMSYVDKWKYYYHESPGQNLANGDRFAFRVANLNFSISYIKIANFSFNKYCDPIAEKYEESCYRVFSGDTDDALVRTRKKETYPTTMKMSEEPVQTAAAIATEGTSISGGILAMVIVVVIVWLAMGVALISIRVKIITGFWCPFTCSAEDGRLRSAATSTGAIDNTDNHNDETNSSELQRNRKIPKELLI